MSLINQMLRDLQEQKGRTPQTKKSLKPSAMERIPFLPLPLVLGGGGLLLLLLIWWFSGVLSEQMSVVDSADVQQLAPASSTSSDQTALNQGPTASPIPDQLTMEERLAEPGTELTETKTAPPANQAAETENKKVLVAESSKSSPAKLSAKRPAPTKTVVSQPLRKKTSKKTESVARKAQSNGSAAKVETIRKVPARLHPDDLPGAVKSPKPVAVNLPPLAVRPNKVPAVTPYGKAEEAYLDGLWALEQQRSNLAVRSFQYALNVYPGHLKSREVLAEVQEQGGHVGEAILLMSEGLEIAPDHMAFRKRYAQLLIKQGDYDAATKVLLSNGMPGVAEDPEAHTILASLYQKLEEHFLAAQTYRNLLVSWPQTGAFWVGLGSALEGQGLRADAAGCYRKALKTDNLRDDLSKYAKRRIALLQ